jgi:hypothetical protein
MSQAADDAKNGSEPYAKAPIKGTDIRNTPKDNANKGTDIRNTPKDNANKGTDIRNTPTDNANKGTDIRNTPTDSANKGTDNPATGYARGRAPAASGAVGPEARRGRAGGRMRRHG